ncbi:2-acylglycerol O-acyltransferase 3-like [Suncus etruscus]|uniref:2-acylglycerol O-acyltransferase 3-like n=1 Tax=Suncus etruscus TaxID=109475 RepID=UPI00210F7F2D|nr:2-acylglycerol O-acyltransferase 3-like [Suncus etruscus]
MEDSKAPLSTSSKTSWKHCLDILGAYQYVMTFLFLGPFFSFLTIYLLFTPLWWLSVLYGVWLIIDWDTPQKGGWSSKWIRKCVVWNDMRDHYPIKLVKTAELPPDRNYVLGAHPHGIICMGPTCNFLTGSTGFFELFPRLHLNLTTLVLFFCLPLLQDYLMALGLCLVSQQSLDFLLLSRPSGQAMVIMVGGAQEMLDTIPGVYRLILHNRKGFMRLTLRHGASLVPVHSFGENSIFRAKSFEVGSWQYAAQVTFKKIAVFPPNIFWGRSLCSNLFSPNSWGLLPLSKPITTVVGRPIPVPQLLQPSEDQVNHYHQLYMRELQQLFEEHKVSYGVPASVQLTLV